MKKGMSIKILKTKKCSNAPDDSKKTRKIRIVPVEDVRVVVVTSMHTSYLCFKCGGMTHLDSEDDDMLECLECNTSQFVGEV